MGDLRLLFIPCLIYMQGQTPKLFLCISPCQRFCEYYCVNTILDITSSGPLNITMSSTLNISLSIALFVYMQVLKLELKLIRETMKFLKTYGKPPLYYSNPHGKFLNLQNTYSYEHIRVIKGHLHYKTITSQNVLPKAQVKNFFILQKSNVSFSRYSSSCIFNYPVIQQICDVMMSIST